MYTTESDEMNVKRIARCLKGVSIAKCLIEINRFPPFVNVYTDSGWAGTCTQIATGQDNTKRARAPAVESLSGEARLCLLGQKHNSQ